MRIGILTFHRAYNCGAMLQAWALKKTLERMGHKVEFPTCNHVGESKRWKVAKWHNPSKRGFAWVYDVVYSFIWNVKNIPRIVGSIPCEDILRTRYKAFRIAHIPERDCSPREFIHHYDVLVYGSDQIWNQDIAHPYEDLFLNEHESGVPAIAYAASYGDERLEDDKLRRMIRALSTFSAISVRETLAKDQLSIYSQKPIEETIDPTLLVTPEMYDEISYGSVPKEPYLFMYTLFTTDFFIRTAKMLARRLGVKCVIAPCSQYSRWLSPMGLTYSISPDRLVEYAKHAKYVLAGSFHGTVMGVIFKKPFLSLRKQIDGNESRPAALLRKLGMSNRLVTPETTIDEMERILRTPLPDFQNQLDNERRKSLRWLATALQHTKDVQG